jgi:hypothetical protein
MICAQVRYSRTPVVPMIGVDPEELEVGSTGSQTRHNMSDLYAGIVTSSDCKSGTPRLVTVVFDESRRPETAMDTHYRGNKDKALAQGRGDVEATTNFELSGSCRGIGVYSRGMTVHRSQTVPSGMA